MKFLIFISFLMATVNHASMLHDVLRSGDLETLRMLLDMGAHDATYRPDAIDRSTGQTTMDALAECADEQKREAMKAILIAYCEKYNVTISEGAQTHYATSIADRRYPRLTMQNEIAFFEDHEILELFLPTGQPKRIGKSAHAIPVGAVWVVQQNSNTSCGVAVRAMREIDLFGTASHYPSFASGISRGELIARLDAYNIDVEAVVIDSYSDDIGFATDKFLAEQIPVRGPAIVNGVNKKGGGHWAIVDEVVLPSEVSTGHAIIREPFHGWRIKVTISALRKFLGLEPWSNCLDDNIDDLSEVSAFIDILWTSKKT